MKTKFYVGEMRSDFATIHGLTEEVHFLTKLSYVITAHDEGQIAYIDDVLRRANEEFIRSDNEIRTYVALDIFNGLTEEAKLR